jgi:hypothetical protein
MYPPECFPSSGVGARAASHGPGVLTSKKGGSDSSSETELRTTRQIRNLPNNYSKEEVMALIDSMGFAGSYDYFYLPLDFKKGSNLGYAYVNFVSVAKAKECFAAFDGFREWPFGVSQKICEVCWGKVQGYEANVKKWTYSTWPEEYKPVIFKKGRLETF